MNQLREQRGYHSIDSSNPAVTARPTWTIQHLPDRNLVQKPSEFEGCEGGYSIRGDDRWYSAVQHEPLEGGDRLLRRCVRDGLDVRELRESVDYDGVMGILRERCWEGSG